MNAPRPRAPIENLSGDVAGGLAHLRSAGTSLVVDLRGSGVPRLVHWGADLGDLDPVQLADLSVVAVGPSDPGGPTLPALVRSGTAGGVGTAGTAGGLAGVAVTAARVRLPAP
jgi:alpha-galactosidase